MIEITAEVRADRQGSRCGIGRGRVYRPVTVFHCKKCGGRRPLCHGKTLCRAASECQREAEEQRKAAESGSAAWSVSNAERHRDCKTAIS